MDGQCQKNTCKIFIEIYNEDTDIGCLIEVSVQYHENLHKIHNEFTLFDWKKESWKKKKKKVKKKKKKKVGHLHDKEKWHEPWYEQRARKKC